MINDVYEEIDITKNMTPSEKAKAMRDEVKEDEEKMNIVAEGGSESEDILKEDFEKEMKEQIDKSELAKEITSKSGRWWSTYAQNICDYGEYLLKKIDWPPFWAVVIMPTDGSSIKLWGKPFGTIQGVLIAVRDPRGKIHARGMETCMDPDIDIFAIETLVTQAENTLDSYKGILEGEKMPEGMKVSDSGIVF